LASLSPYDPDNVNERRRIVFSEEMGQGPVRFLINGETFEHERIDFHSQLGSIEIWEVINNADMDHPFHLHIYPFIVLTRNGNPSRSGCGATPSTWRRVTGSRLFVPFEHFSATICHYQIVEHEDQGMMAQFAVVSRNEDR
jgi:FtsP/CotA-like multicopper oxidase with cupredoxin domain